MSEEKQKSNYEKLSAINVGGHIEKKNGLNYLSWAWAVDQLLRADPDANWMYGEPMKWGETVMVFCTVTAFGKSMTSQLPVMDYKNRAIQNPDAFAVNTAMQRCLAKAIALHGLGLYIYAGEDLPLEEAEERQQEKEKRTRLPALTDEEAKKAYETWLEEKLQFIDENGHQDVDAITKAWGEKTSNVRTAIKKYGESLKADEGETELDKQAKAHLSSI